MGVGDSSRSDAEQSNPVRQSIRAMDRCGLSIQTGKTILAANIRSQTRMFLTRMAKTKPLQHREISSKPANISSTKCGIRKNNKSSASRDVADIFGKQNWRCRMNRKPGYGAQLRANLEPTKGVGRLRQQDGGHGSRNPLRSV
ncbi:hypothetical protein YC2023_072130 [Brassica napus]